MAAEAERRLTCFALTCPRRFHQVFGKYLDLWFSFSISVKLAKLLPTLNLGPTESAFSGHSYSYFGSRTNPLFSALRQELCCMSISGFTEFTQETPRESKWISGVDLRKDTLTLGYKTALSWDGGRKAWDNASREKMLQKTQWVPAGFSIL